MSEKLLLGVHEKLADMAATQKTMASQLLRVHDTLHGRDGLVERIAKHEACPALAQWRTEQTARTQALDRAQSRLLATPTSLPPAQKLAIARWKAISLIVAAILSALAGGYGVAEASRPSTVAAP